MRLSNLFLLSCAVLRATTTTVCDSGCDQPTANLQTVINALASCGNHIQLKAQTNPYPTVILTGGNSMQCGANPNYLENFNMAALPPTGTVVTAAYLPLTPKITATNAQKVALVTHNGNVDCGGGGNPSCPANGWVIQGLKFDTDAARGFSPCFIVFGQFAGNCSQDPAIITQADMPHNITFRSNIVRPDPRSAARRCIGYDTVTLTVQDNWIDCIFPEFLDINTSDSQALSGSPVGTPSAYSSIKNNVIIGTTTPITFGGYPSAVHTPVGVPAWMHVTTSNAQYINVTNNHDMHPTSEITATWAGNTFFRVGQAVQPVAGYASKLFLALTSGKTSGVEPNWAGMGSGTTLVDGGVTWYFSPNVWAFGNCSYGVKNHFETKSGIFINVANNFLDRNFAQCASGGAQGRSLTPEIQTSGNGGGAASTFQNHDYRNNLATNVAAAFGTLARPSTDDSNRFPRFFTSNAEPYAISAGVNDSLRLSVDGAAAVVITLTAGATRSAAQIAADINSQGNASTAAAIPFAPSLNDGTTSTCPTTYAASTGCKVLIMRATNASPNSNAANYTSDAIPSVYNGSNVSISIGPAAGTTATSVLGLPANGTNIYWCTEPLSVTWYGCGSGSNISFVNNTFQMRHDGIYAPAANYMGNFNSGFINIQVDHNVFDDPTGWWSPFFTIINTPRLVNLFSVQNGLIQNTIFRDYGHYLGDSSGGAALDWSGINTICQTATINAPLTTGGDQSSTCDAAHIKGGFTKNFAPGIGYANGTCSAGVTCNTNPNNGDLGFGVQPNDNFNDAFSGLTFQNSAAGDYTLVYNPASPQTYVNSANCPSATTACKLGNDNRPVGVDMNQMNYVRLAAGSPQISDRAAVFTFNVTPPIQNLAGMFTVATDPFCYSPVADMDPTAYTNPGWTGNDHFPQFGASKTVVVGLNSALAASTQYYYCLEYQGYAMAGTFTTLGALVGTRTIKVQTKLTTNAQGATGAADMIVEYGTTYSRATDTISGGSTTSPVACTVGGATCTATFSATAGAPLFYRYKIRNGATAVIVTQPVIAQTPL